MSSQTRDYDKFANTFSRRENNHINKKRKLKIKTKFVFLNDIHLNAIIYKLFSILLKVFIDSLI